MPHSAFEKRWSQNLPAYGGWLVEPSESALDAYVQAGFHYVGLDCQHALLDETEAAKMLVRLRDAPFAVLTRVSENALAPIGKLLDAGSDGVIVPGVNTAEEAHAAATACRYPPRGTRSMGPIRAGMGLNPEQIEQRALCLVMIETKQGLENVEAICRVPGVSGVYIGPGDLSIGLGLSPMAAFSSDQLAEPIARIKAACDANRLVLGSHSLDAAFTRKCVQWGCKFISLGTNTMLFGQAAKGLFEQLKASEK